MENYIESHIVLCDALNGFLFVSPSIEISIALISL